MLSRRVFNSMAASMAEQGEDQDHNRVVVVEFVENGRVAIVRMQHTDNRFNPKFVKDFNSALDKVERCKINRLAHTLSKPHYLLYSHSYCISMLQ